jgi:hypothetical protein
MTQFLSRKNQPSHVVRSGIFPPFLTQGAVFLRLFRWTLGSSSICYSSGGGVERSPLP